MGAAAGAVSEKPIIMSEKSEETQELVLSALASNILFKHTQPGHDLIYTTSARVVQCHTVIQLDVEPKDKNLRSVP